jgi:hypothetical protein
MTDGLPAPRTPLPPPPSWWADLQRRFGEALHAPLRVEGGTFVSPTHELDPTLLAAVRGGGPGVSLTPAAQVAVYHRQVWARWFEGLQAAHPFTVEALGPWRFNHLAALHLARRPPCHRDVDAIADGFVALVRAGLPPAPSDPLVAAHLAAAARSPDEIADALDVDEAQRAAFFAAWPEPWTIDPARVADIWDRRVRRAPGTTALLLRGPRRDASALVIGRTAHGTHRTPVPPVWATLLCAAERAPLGEAVTQTASPLDDAGRRAFTRALPTWIGQAVTQRWWVGVEP